MAVAIQLAVPQATLTTVARMLKVAMITIWFPL